MRTALLHLLLPVLMISIFSLAPSHGALAAGINTNVALPVRKGGFVFRSQVRWLRAQSDTASERRETDIVTIPNVLVYGVTPDFSLFAIVPYVFRSEERIDIASGTSLDRDDNGIGDAVFLGRYTVYSRDNPTGTRRLALLGGLKLPTGDDDLKPITTDSVDFPLGAVATSVWDSGRHELDADLTYRINTEAEGFDKGDELRYNIAYQLRVFPWTLPDSGTPNFLYLVAEVNGIFLHKSELDGRTIGDSGGNTLFLSPGLQFATIRFIFEASVQIPVVQRLNGAQAETDFILTAGFRVNLP